MSLITMAGDVRTDDSVLEEENRLNADLAQYDQILRNLTDRYEFEDSDSGESSVASNRALSPSPYPIEPHRETTNERATSVANIPIPQFQDESGFSDNRGQTRKFETEGVIRTHRAILATKI